MDLGHIIGIGIVGVVDVLPAQNLALVARQSIDSAVDGAADDPVLNHVHSAGQLIFQVGSQVDHVAVADSGGQVAHGPDDIPFLAGCQSHVHVGSVLEQGNELQVQFKIGDAQIVSQVLVDETLNLVDLSGIGECLHGGEAQLNLIHFAGRCSSGFVGRSLGLAAGSGCSGGLGGGFAAAGSQTQNHHDDQQHCNDLLHSIASI